jgi:hypothetical protein
MNSIFIESFKRGLLGARPDETIDQARERFIRESEDMELPPTLTPPAFQSCQMTIAEYATHYRSSIRTIERLKAAGVDLDNPAQVAAHLVNLQSPSIPMLERIDELLGKLTTIDE